MSLKFKLTFVIFMMILVVIVILSAFTFTGTNREMQVPAFVFTLVILAAAAVIPFFFARSAARQKSDVTNTLKYSAEDEAGSPEGMIANIQPAAATLVNNISVKNMIESYEEGLAGMQDVVADIREIIYSIDTVLQEFEAIDNKRRVGE
jgi:hypothetical protein